MISCGQSGNNPDYHFAGAGKMIETGKGAAGGARRGESKEVETAAFVSVMQMGGFFITGCSCPMSGVDPCSKAEFVAKVGDCLKELDGSC